MLLLYLAHKLISSVGRDGSIILRIKFLSQLIKVQFMHLCSNFTI